jgi:hypothetical protein
MSSRSFLQKAGKTLAKPKTQIYFDVILSLLACLVIVLRLNLLEDEEILGQEIDDTQVYIMSESFVTKMFPRVAIPVFGAYFVKPWIILIILKLRGIKTRMSYFTGEIFFMRLVYDIFFILASTFSIYDNCIKSNKFDIKLPAIMILCCPVILGEFLIYMLCVLPQGSKNEKLRYRMVKTRVSTDYENSQMYSTDEDDAPLSQPQAQDDVSSNSHSV